MKSSTTGNFWQSYRALSPEVQESDGFHPKSNSQS
jgi:hypothetical protein